MPGSPKPFKIFAHIAGWTVVVIMPLLFAPSHEVASYFTDLRILWSHLLRNALLISLFYFNLLYLTPVVLPTRGVLTFFVTLASLVVFASTLNWFLHETLTGMFEHFPPFAREGDRPPMPPPGFGIGRPRPVMLAGPYFASFLITTVVASASTVIVLWNNWMKAKEHEQEITYEKVAAELSMLKLQVSPHFLFNTLNNIRWLVRSKSDRAEEAVVKLSHLLRYILYHTNEVKVSLEKEIAHLRDYVSLQEMRLSDDQSMEFVVEGDVERKVIVPLLLIPFVENFFKHADFSSGFINRIHLKIDRNVLMFTTTNKFNGGKDEQRDPESGIGLENVKKRLQLHYQDQHILQYSTSDDVFTVKLEVILS